MYTTEGDIRHKKHNWQVVQIVNTMFITIVNSLKSNVKEKSFNNVSLLDVY